MSTSIQRFEGTLEARVRTWAALSDGDLRRRAVTAATNRDLSELWGLTEAYLVLHGRSGAKVSEHTIDNYSRGIHTLLEHWHGENILRPARDAAREYVRRLEIEGLAPGSVRIKLASARVLYKALRWASATDAAPFLDVKAAKDGTAPEDKRQAYKEEEVQAMLARADELDAALVLLGGHGGLRIAEILALRWTDVNLTAGRLHVRSGKGRKERNVRTSTPLIDALQRLKATTAGEYVIRFRTGNRARQRIERLCELAGIEYKGIHSLRHYCGTRLYQATGDIRLPQKHLGHSSSTTTQIYAKMDTRALESSIAAAWG